MRPGRNRIGCNCGTSPAWSRLAGLIGQFWHRDYGIVRTSSEEFASFDRPGYAKTVAGFTLHPHGEGRTLLTYESRTVSTDAAARGRFAAYWFVLRPFVRLMLRGALVSMKRSAEHGTTSRPTTSFAPLQPNPPVPPAENRCTADAPYIWSGRARPSVTGRGVVLPERLASRQSGSTTSPSSGMPRPTATGAPPATPGSSEKRAAGPAR